MTTTVEPLVYYYGLTRRELVIVHLIAEGMMNREIAERLGISVFTVDKHVCNLLRKMNVRSRLDAAVLAVRTERRELFID